MMSAAAASGHPSDADALNARILALESENAALQG